jgi:hypothetical protein
VTLEASRAGLSGIVIWGLHRDTAELHIIRLPVFSLGALPAGPQALIHRTRLHSLRPPAASTSSPPTTSWWETTTVSCLCRWIVPAMLRIWQPTSGIRNASKRRECNSAPASGASPASTNTSWPDNLAETSPSDSTCARLVGRSKSDPSTYLARPQDWQATGSWPTCPPSSMRKPQTARQRPARRYRDLRSNTQRERVAVAGRLAAGCSSDGPGWSLALRMVASRT